MPEPNAARLINLEGEYALELLQAGRSLESVRQFERVLGLHRAPNAVPFRGRRDASFLRNSLALAWLRLGEQENCLSNHTARSCILPVDPSAVHPLPRGSRQAIGVLREQLAEHPEDLQARWLLNLAHMTLGEYPAPIPVFTNPEKLKPGVMRSPLLNVMFYNCAAPNWKYEDIIS